MRKFFQIAAWVIVIGGIIVGWQVYTKNESKIKSTESARKEIAHKAIKEITHKAIIELADKYNAVVDWSEPLSKIMSPVYTVEIENALLLKDSRPVLFLASVIDIERKENAYMVRFSNDFGEDPQIEFALNCSDEQVRKITQQQSESREWENYAVIAVINKVKKVRFNFVAITEGSEDSYSASIRLENSDTFIATGHCLDLVFVGSCYDLKDLLKDNKK